MTRSTPGSTASEGPQALFAGRILPFDERAALRWAELMADGKKRGRPRSARDMIIAAIADTSGCIIVTANERDFGLTGRSYRGFWVAPQG